MSAAESGADTPHPLARFLVRGEAPNGRNDEIKAFGTRFPSGRVVIEWRREAWPEAKRLNGPHQSVYHELEDFTSTLNNDRIEWMDAEETKYGGQL